MTKRIQLDLPNRRLFDSFEARVALGIEFRKYRPKLVLGFGEKTPLASPDHWQAMQITDAAVFYSRLCKWDEHFAGLPVHTISSHLYYTLAFGALGLPPAGGHLVVDITDTLEEDRSDSLLRDAVPARQGPRARAVRAFALQQGTGRRLFRRRAVGQPAHAGHARPDALLVRHEARGRATQTGRARRWCRSSFISIWAMSFCTLTMRCRADRWQLRRASPKRRSARPSSIADCNGNTKRGRSRASNSTRNSAAGPIDVLRMTHWPMPPARSFA